MGSQFRIGHVSLGPPLIPDVRISRVRLAAAAFPKGPSQSSRGLSSRQHTPLERLVIPLARQLFRLSSLFGSESARCFRYDARHLPRAPLHANGVTTCAVDSGLLGPALPGRLRSYWLMRLTKSLPPPLVPLGRWVFAGCGEPLLVVGDSRRYLHNPCVGAWTRTPSRFYSAMTRYLPIELRPHLRFNKFGARYTPRSGFTVGIPFRGCSHSFMFRLPHLLDPRTAPTAKGSVSLRAAGPFTPRNVYEVTLRKLWYRYMSESGK